MLARSVTLLPQLRGELPKARFPLGDQAYSGESETLVPISSTNTRRLASTSPATRLKNSRRSERVAEGRSSRSASSSLLAFSSILGLEPGRFFGARERPSSASLA